MPDRIEEVRAAPAFEGQWLRLGLSQAGLNDLLGSIWEEARLRLPRPAADGLMWFERQVPGHQASFHGGGRIWAGCEQRGADLVLERLATERPPP